MIGSIARKFSSSRRRAQGMTEYIIIVALVAIALITIITLFGNKIKFLFTAGTKSLEDGKVYNAEKVNNNADLIKDVGKKDAEIDNSKHSHNLRHTDSAKGGSDEKSGNGD